MMRARACVVALGVAVVAPPARAQTAPPHTHVEARRDDQVVEDATFALLGLWIMSTWAAEIGDAVCNGSCTDHSYDLLYVPVVGPAIAAAMPGVHRAGDAWAVMLAADSVLQAGAGLVALVAYLLPTRRVVVADRTSWTVTPAAAGATVGMTLTIRAF